MMIHSLFLVLSSLVAVSSTRVMHRFLPTGPVTGVDCEAMKAYPSAPDSYISVFKPCEITFYGQTNRNRRRFQVAKRHEELASETYNKTVGQKCDDLTGDLDVIKVTERKVFMLPDSCVSQMDVCFDAVAEKDVLEKSFLFFNTTYELDFPEGATGVSVNCENDHESLVDFAYTFSTLGTFFSWLQAFVIAFLIFFVCFLLGTIMMFCGGCVRLISCVCCRCGGKSKQGQYTPIPTAPPEEATIPVKIV